MPLQVVQSLKLSANKYQTWETCWQGYGSSSKNGKIAAADKLGMHENDSGRPWYSKIMITINSKLMMGSPDKVWLRVALHVLAPFPPTHAHGHLRSIPKQAQTSTCRTESIS